MPVQCVKKKKNCAVQKNKYPIKPIFLLHVKTQAEVILKPLSGIRVALVPSMVDVAVSLTLFSPVW